MSLSRLRVIARRYWWLLLVGPLIGAVVAFLLVRTETPQYSAIALLRINPQQIGDSLDAPEPPTIATLGATYRLYVWTDEVLTPVVTELNLDETPTELGLRISAWTMDGTQLMRIAAEDADPNQAAAIANAVAASLARRVSAESRTMLTAATNSIDSELARLETEMASLTDRLTAAEADAPSGTNFGSAALQQQLSEFESIYSETLATRAAVALNRGFTDQQLAIAAPASPPTESDASSVPLTTLFGLMAGALVAAAVVTGLLYLDRTIAADTDIAAVSGSRLLGILPARRAGHEAAPALLETTPTPMANAIRDLRTALLATFRDTVAANGHGPGVSIAVMSADPAVATSTIAADLALALAQGGMPTVLIDANWSTSAQQRLFAIKNGPGLSTLLRQPTTAWQAAASVTTVSGLKVMASGPALEHPADWLGRDQFDRQIDEIAHAGQVVIIDSPALDTGSEARVLAAAVAGVVLVVAAGRTTVDQLAAAARTIRAAGGTLAGVIVSQTA